MTEHPTAEQRWRSEDLIAYVTKWGMSETLTNLDFTYCMTRLFIHLMRSGPEETMNMLEISLDNAITFYQENPDVPI